MRGPVGRLGKAVRGVALALLALCGGLGMRCSLGQTPNHVVVKFVEGLEVQLDGKTFRARVAKGATGAPDPATVSSAVAALNERIAREDVLRMEPLFAERERPGAEEVGMDMRLFFTITLAVGTPDAVGERLAADLGKIPIVQEAYLDVTPEDASGGDAGTSPKN
jgi:hypothetical protein